MMMAVVLWRKYLRSDRSEDVGTWNPCVRLQDNPNMDKIDLSLVENLYDPLHLEE